MKGKASEERKKKVLKEGWSLIRVVFRQGFHRMDKKRGGLSQGCLSMGIPLYGQKEEWSLSGVSFNGDSTVWTKRGVVSLRGLSLGIPLYGQKEGWSLSGVSFNGDSTVWTKRGVVSLRGVFHWGFHCMDKKRGGLSQECLSLGIPLYGQKEGWSLIRVVFYWGFHCMDKKWGDLSSRVSFTGDSTVWTKRGVVSHQGGLSLGIPLSGQKEGWSLIRVVFHWGFN